MLAPRAVRPATSLLRSFSSLSVAYHCPSIRDITVESTEQFLRRQKEFRENLARLRKEQQESKFANTVTSSSKYPRPGESALIFPRMSSKSSCGYHD